MGKDPGALQELPEGSRQLPEHRCLLPGLCSPLGTLPMSGAQGQVLRCSDAWVLRQALRGSTLGAPPVRALQLAQCLPPAVSACGGACLGEVLAG